MTDCRHFNGYKPCGKSEICDSLCPSLNIPQTRILLIHLEALGAVLRTTSLLPAIKRKFPNSHITWVTQKPAELLLKGNPLLDRVLTTSADDLLALSCLEFDIAFTLDKSLKAGGVLKQTYADFVYGFQVDPTNGAIVPATAAAEELWQLGLNNQKKFFENQKPETQLSCEAAELTYQRDEYILVLNEAEQRLASARRKSWGGEKKLVVGFNTGCAATIPFKKLSIEMHRELARRLLGRGDVQIVLLGGREDTLRNQRIGYGLDLTQSPTEDGLRDGAVSVAACDLVVTGDSFGMHLAIALKKWTVAWFGPTCSQEIDLYGRGVKIQTHASCSPCWKRDCQKNPMCYDLVSVDELVAAVEKGLMAVSAKPLEKSREINPCSKGKPEKEF
jgi:heptosyltransferase-2